MLRKCWWVVVLSCGLAVGWAGAGGHAQETKKRPELAPTDKSAEKEVKGRLPRYFGQIGLSKKQEEEMRKVAQPFDERISQLRKQINEFEKQIDDHESAKIAACEKLLTEAQKAALKERRDTAELERANRKKPSGKSSPEGSESREK